MQVLVMLGLIGFGAQMIDGSLGMGFGATSATMLLAIGTSPALASATVHLTQVGTTLASGLSHWRFGNVDWQVVRRIAVPGGIGAFAGATFLSSLSTTAATPLVAGVLLVLGTYILLRFTTAGVPQGKLGQPLKKRVLAPLGVVAGFVNATAGGGWGPINTSSLLASGRLEPRRVVGSVGTSEFMVAVGASTGFVFGLGLGGIQLSWVAMMLAGGIVAAPIAAWLARHVPARVLGSAVGGLLVLLNVRTLASEHAFALPEGARAVIYTGVVLVWATALLYTVRAHRQQSRSDVANRVPARPPSP
ncbi:sulfite exporter TauE/SafE family protein [Actinobacteria bacterium YIM 96077]|uniref:Probable membrane transporter protein n=1 Tax=Phytoactinopolyspora halophila TaxID=1981511 RepID=A0A329QFW7_9ACTN|nr:sulfite exporter TauE/SafE family protein [Phytoactinopolyspora halophila]AYY13646.1 sulfite exporter TauE/SafE family protein [Actinobacteria bacterium YIM 96077]RAW11210.1 sulfite exporter TauE/SafE family protein [Phytoactinopolyspora halophila]